jgi:hypothetical protein
MVNEELATHLNYFREVCPYHNISLILLLIIFVQRTGGVTHVPRIGYAVYKNKFQEPSLSEGYSEIKKINFAASFETDEIRKKFYELA